MEASKEDWVNFVNYYGKNCTLCNHWSASILFRFNPLCVGGLQLFSLLKLEYFYIIFEYLFFCNIEVSKPKWLNSLLNIIGVNSLTLGGLRLVLVDFKSFNSKKYFQKNFYLFFDMNWKIIEMLIFTEK